ncbi:hypothetical protein CRYUN_Cryun30bG0043500 [Craigia yunnanensis]
MACPSSSNLLEGCFYFPLLLSSFAHAHMLDRLLDVAEVDCFHAVVSAESYDCAINIEDLIKLSDVMTEHSLGPNGGLVYCMDYLAKNTDWLQSELEPLLKEEFKLVFDGEPQAMIEQSIDAHLCSDPGNYVSVMLLSLSIMLHLELPHINVLSKIDLIESYGKLAFHLDFYTDVQDLSYLQHHLDQDPCSAKYRIKSVWNLVKLIGKSDGYIYAGIDACAVEFSKIAFTAAAMQEKYMKYDENYDDND